MANTSEIVAWNIICDVLTGWSFSRGILFVTFLLAEAAWMSGSLLLL